MLNTAVLLLAYARPNATRLVWASIREARPPRLYISQDGPKTTSGALFHAWQETNQIIRAVDWPCETFYLVRPENLGCREAVSNAISWFFEHEPEGIILEDDCLPSRDFFPFCEQLLTHYRDDVRVMHIAGTNQQFGKQRGNASYYFSNVASIWGWAAWRRSWQYYDIMMSNFPEFRDGGMMRNVFFDDSTAKNATEILQLNVEGKISTWDHQYGYSLICNNGLSVIPNINLITNLGFAKDDDQTTAVDNFLASQPAGQINFPLKHPKFFVANKAADIMAMQWSMEDSISAGKRKLQAYKDPF